MPMSKGRSLSRQAIHQQDRVIRGLCSDCGAPRGASIRYCDRCLVRKRERRRVREGRVPYKLRDPRGGRPPLVTEA